MQEPVNYRSGHDAHGGKHRQPRIKGIASREDLARLCLYMATGPIPPRIIAALRNESSQERFSV